MKVALRVVSNLSFTATFDVQKTPGFLEKPGVFCILDASRQGSPFLLAACDLGCKIALDQATHPACRHSSAFSSLEQRVGK